MGNIGSCVSKLEKNKVNKKTVVLQDNHETQISCELQDYNDKIKDLVNKLNTVRQNYDERMTETVYKMNNLEEMINNMAKGENSKISTLEQDHNDKINSLKKDYDDKIELLNAELNYLKIYHNIKIEKIEENFSNLENECNKNTEGLEQISDEINSTEIYTLSTNVNKINIIDSLESINTLQDTTFFLEPLYLSLYNGVAHLFGSIYSNIEYEIPSKLKILDRVLYIQTNLSYSASKHSSILFLEKNKIKFTNSIDMSDDATETKTFRRYNKNSKFNKISTINIHFKL